ncbi:MAG: hypothetical protein ACR2ND_01880 [Solirubrobacteraceae bacterium]
MPNRLKQVHFVRLAVVTAVLAFPLIASGVAQAAIAGALPASSSTQPNVVAATAINSAQAEVCFDKAVQLGVAANTGFTLGGYRAGNNFASTTAHVDPTNSQCVIATYTVGNQDINNYTIMKLKAGAVVSNSGSGAGNLADSVAMFPNTAVGPASHDGTTGVSTAPNLVGILAPNGSNQISKSLTFVFDRNTTVVTPASFFFVDSAGNACAGAATLMGNGTTTVTVSFGTTAPATFTGAGCNGATVANAVRGGVLVNGTSAGYDPNSLNYNETAILPNCASPCATQRPDLVSAVINPGNFDQVIYTFDKSVIAGPGSATGFVAELSNGKTLTGIPAYTGTNVVNVTFGGAFSKEAEYGVTAYSNYAAVRASDNNTISGDGIPGSANIGDNAGAFSSGFTTGPDVFGVTISHSIGTVTVNLDQRITAAVAADFTLLTSQGQPIVATPTTAFNSSAAPGPATLTLTYSPSLLTNATMVQFAQGAMTTPLTPVVATADGQNVPQVVTAVQSAAILKAYKAYKAHHHSSKHHKKHHSSKKR